MAGAEIPPGIGSIRSEGTNAARSRTVWANRDDPARNPCHVIFRTIWHLDAEESEALAVLYDYENFSRWWRRTFLVTEVVSRPDHGLLGLTGNVTSRGALPYIFRWEATVIEVDPDRITLSAKGDFNGTGTFRRPEQGETADLYFDWDVEIGKPLLRAFCPYACRLYLWNHAFAMADGARSLQAEIARRRRAKVEPPKVDLLPRPLGPIELFRKGSANILTTIQSQLLSQPMISGRMGWKWHSIAGPDEMHRVLVENDANYPKAPVVRRILRPAVRQSMFLADGADHIWQRRAAATYFTMKESIKAIPTIREAVEVQVDRLPAEPKFRMDVLPHMINLTLSVILRVSCSTGAAVNPDQLREAFGVYLKTVARLTPLDMLNLPPRIASALRGSARAVLPDLQRQIDAFIHDRLAEGPRGRTDMLQGLIESTDPATGKPMSVAQVRDNILLLVIAGHETTANTLAWAVYLLATHANIQESARQEALAAFAGPAEDLYKSLPLICNVIDETLRLYPALPLLSRKARADDQVGACPVGRGDFMFVPLYALHRSRSYWDAPDQFCPERFAPDAARKIGKDQYLPFSAGPRSCVGTAFALLEMRVVLADFLRRFRFTAVPGRAPDPVALLALKPEGGVWIDVERIS